VSATFRGVFDMNRELIRRFLLTVMASAVGCLLLAAQAADTKAAETITALREPDGSWRVIGYFIN